MGRAAYGKDWRKISSRVLAEEPECRECATFGITRAATEVDHIRALSDGGTNDRENLQPLCRRHHAKKTVRDSKVVRARWLPTEHGMARDAIRIQLDAMWTRDERGRIFCENDGSGNPGPLLCVAVPTGGQRLIEVGSTVSDDCFERATEILAGTMGEPSSNEVPKLLDALGLRKTDTRVVAGPTYTFPPNLPRIALEDGARLVWSQDPDAKTLIDGRSTSAREHLFPLFPTWTAVVADGRILSMCSTVRQSDKGAEAGVDTAAKHRGRGFATAATTLWADKMKQPGRSLFYSTSHDNTSSQRVAERLQLKQLGTLWTLRAEHLP